MTKRKSDVEGYSAYRDRAISDGRSAVKEPWFELAVTTITTSSALSPLLTVDAQDVNPEEIARQVYGAERSVLPGRLLAESEEIPQTLPDEIDAVISKNPDVTNRAGWLWGTVLARISSEDASGAKLEACWLLASNHDVSAEAFLEELSGALASDRFEAVNKCIYTIARKITMQPERWVYRGEQERFLQALKEWNKEQNIAQIWNLRLFDYFSFHYDSIGVFDALRRTDPASYLALLDEICLPPVTDYALRHLDIVEDLETILKLLKSAPVVARETNGLPMWNRNFSAAFLLKIALDYARGIGDVGPSGHHENKETTAEWDKEAENLFRQVATVLVGREDGLFLTLHWMCYLVRIDKPHPWGRKAWSPIPAALEEIAAVLNSHGVGLQHFKTIFPQFFDYDEAKLKALRLEGIGDLERYANPAGIDMFFIAFRIHNASDRSNRLSIDDEYLTFFESLLIRHDGGLRLTAHESDPQSNLWSPALMYAMTENPPEAWGKTWNILVEQRRVYRHRWSDDRTMWADDPSFFLANIGLLLIDWLMAPEIGKKEHVARIFSVAFDAVLGVVFSPPSFNNGRWRHLFASLFSRLPHVTISEERATFAAKHLWKIGGDAELFVWCLSNVILNGIEVEEVANILQREMSIDLKKLLDGYIYWEGRESNKRPNQKLVEECHRMGSLLTK